MSYPSKCAISSILLPNPTLSILERWMLVVSQGRRPWFRSKITSGCRFAKSSLLVPPGDFHFSFSPALDPIISCPLSGSVCYAIGLRGPNRRAVCFVSLIAERLSGGPLSLLPLSLHPVCHPSLRSPSSPFSFVPSAERRSGAAAILFLENDQQARTFVRSFSRRNAGSQLFLSFSSSFFFSSPLLSLSLSFSFSFFLWSRCRAAYGGAMANSAPDSHEAGRKRTDLDRKNGRVLYRWCEYLEHDDDPEKPRVIPIFSSGSGWFLRIVARSSINTLVADAVDRSFWVIVAGKRKLKCAAYSL